MGETDFHIGAMLYLREALQYFLRNEPRTYVAANLMFYFEEGNVSAVRCPDVFVVKGVERHDRRVYKLWEEGVAPCVVIEVTSRKTRLADKRAKNLLYAEIGVSEYYLFDPLEEYLQPRLQGFTLSAGRYAPMPPLSDGSLMSQALGAILRSDGRLLRVVDPVTGVVVPTLMEAMSLEEAQAERADAAEAEVARLRAELSKRERTG